MKKIIFLALIFGVLLSFSCKKDEASQTRSAEDAQEFEADDFGPLNPAFVLRVNGSLWAIDEDTGSESDKTRWLDSMSLGEMIFAGETRRATYTDGTPYDFTKVRRETGREGYAFTTQIAVGGELAVVTDAEGAFLYRTPRAVDVSGVVLSYKTVIVCYPETENGGFIQVSGYDPERRDYVRENNSYVRLSSVSRREADIQSSILLQTALSLGETAAEKRRKDALLITALDYSNSVFHAEIQGLVNPNTGGSMQTEAFDMTIILYGDNVEVRDLPDIALGKIVGYMAYDSDVMTVERSAANMSVNGKVGRWIRIRSPLNGWFFATPDMGAFLIEVE